METQSAAQKPQQVRTAVNLLWASLAIGLVKTQLDFSHLSGLAPAAFTSFVLIFTLASIAFLILKISAGRNWARIMFLVMFIIGLLPTLPIVLDVFSRSAVSGALSVVQIGLQAYALFLLFSQLGKHMVSIGCACESSDVELNLAIFRRWTLPDKNAPRRRLVLR